MSLMLLAGSLVLAFDSLTKGLVDGHLAEGQSAFVTPWVRIRPVANRRGMPLLRDARAQALVWAILLACICAIEWQGHFFQQRAARIGLGMALGGAGGNVYDR